MDLESDADRLATIRSVGGVPVRSDRRPEFWAVFDRQFSAVPLGDLDVESRSPALSCRSSDVAGMTKDEALAVGSEEYRMLRVEPDTPAPGWSVVLLRS